MKSILLIALACLIQLSFSSTDVATVTIKEEGIIDSLTQCFGDGQGHASFKFSIAVTTEGFAAPYQFKMLLGSPSYAFATCVVGPQESETRSTSEDEYIDCEIDVSMFPLYQTKVSLLQSYGGDGTFELLNWEKVIGVRNLVEDFTLEGGCYNSYSLTFLPSEEWTDDCTNVRGRHIVSFLGEYNGEYRGALSLVPWFLIENGKYRGAVCELREPTVVANSGQLELVCDLEENYSFIKFFDTTAYDQTTGTNVWIEGTDVVYQLMDCGLSFIKMSGLLLLFALLF